MLRAKIDEQFFYHVKMQNATDRIGIYLALFYMHFNKLCIITELKRKKKH